MEIGWPKGTRGRLLRLPLDALTLLVEPPRWRRDEAPCWNIFCFVLLALVEERLGCVSLVGKGLCGGCWGYGSRRRGEGWCHCRETHRVR